MRIIDKMSYGLLIEDNANCMTVGLYKVVGSDLKDLLPHIANFNKATAGKVWVGDPVEWGKIRAQTWRQIVAKRFDKNADYAHCAADGSNMSDDDVLDYCCLPRCSTVRVPRSIVRPPGRGPALRDRLRRQSPGPQSETPGRSRGERDYPGVLGTAAAA